MKVEIPDALKSDVPQTFWGRILTATPVVMAVVATALAGLASSEMTRAQYSRSLAAQQQAKAGAQWGFFQAKRLRSALQRNTLDVITATTEIKPIATEFTLPALPEMPTNSAELAVALERLQAFDTALVPVIRQVDELEKQSPTRDVVAARLRFNAARYDAEAKLNQTIGILYEQQVQHSNEDADRHHKRSQHFFYGMLAAQAGVIIATFSLAARQRNLLWSLAAAAGAGAVGFAAYVYLFV